MVLQVATDKSSKINLAMHVNREYCDEICRFGTIPVEIKQFFDFTDGKGNPIIKRIQLNMPKDTAENANIKKLSELISTRPTQEFILQYNDKTKDVVHEIGQTKTKFSVLYDVSGGCGVLPSAWKKPVFQNRFQGYAGGMSPDNVAYNLDKIDSVVWAKKRPIWIDAEGRLKQNDMFNINLAQKYIQNALNWQKQR